MIMININAFIFLILFNKICIIFQRKNIFKMEGKLYYLILSTCQKLYILLFR